MNLVRAVSPPGRSMSVTVLGRPPGGNALHRMNHWQVRKERDYWKMATILAVGPIADDPWWSGPMQRATVAVEWRCKTRRRRDFDNLISGLKPLLDGLVEAGVIRDDSTDCLVEIGPLSVTVGWPTDETVMTIQEV